MIDVIIEGLMDEETWYEISDWLTNKGLTPVGYVTLYNGQGWPCAIIGDSTHSTPLWVNSIDMFSHLGKDGQPCGTCFSFSDYQKSEAVQFKMKFLK